MTGHEYKQICAVLDSIECGSIPPVVTATTLPGGAGSDPLFARAAGMREHWPPLLTPLVSLDQVKKLLAFWVQPADPSVEAT